MFSDVLLTVDYDMTLTAPDSSIPQRNLEAIRYFMDHGGSFTLNTGRSVPMTKVFRDRIPTNAPLLLYNGSAAYDPVTGTMPFCHEIQADLWTVIRECQQLLPDLTVEVQGIDAHYCFRADPAWDALCDRSCCARAMAHPGDDLGPFLKFAFYGTIHSDKITDMFQGTPRELARITQAQELLLKKYGDKMEVFRSGARILDVHAKGISKGRSALELKEKLGKKLLICVGDGENDVPMLEAADYAFCPSDSAVADRYPNVCPCAEGAVAEVIYREVPKLLQFYP